MRSTATSIRKPLIAYLSSCLILQSLLIKEGYKRIPQDLDLQRTDLHRIYKEGAVNMTDSHSFILT